MRLIHPLLCLLELHCMAGFRDAQFSSVGGVPRKVTVASIDEWEPCLLVTYHDERAETRWLRVSEETWWEAEAGKTYQLVKTKAIKRADKGALVLREVE